MTLCKNCGSGIKWFKDPVNDKWIPLETDCNLEYESPEEVDRDEVLQWKHKCAAALTCNKGPIHTCHINAIKFRLVCRICLTK